MNIPGNKEFYVADDMIYAESVYDMLKINIEDRDSPFLDTRIENYLGSNLVNDEGESVIGFDTELVTLDVSDDERLFWEEVGNYDEVYYDYKQTVIPHSALPVSFAGNGASSGTVNRITKANGHVYMIHLDKMSIFDDQNDFSYLRTNFQGWGMETIYPNEDQLFIGGRQTVSIYDISNPSTPQWRTEFTHGEACDPVFPFGDVAYVTLRSSAEDFCPGNDNSLLAIDISNLNSLNETKNIDMESPYGLTVIGDLLLVGEGANGLKVFDISDPFKPDLVKFIEDVPAYDIIQHPTNASLVLVAGPEGFFQYSIDGDFELDEVSRINY